MLTDGGGGVAGGPPIRTKEMDELRERLRISEHLMDDMSKTWEEKLQETERIHKVGVATTPHNKSGRGLYWPLSQERQLALENMGISVQASGIGVQTDKFYLVNLNADPSMNELLVCYLKPFTRIGRPNTKIPQVNGMGRGCGLKW